MERIVLVTFSSLSDYRIISGVDDRLSWRSIFMKFGSNPIKNFDWSVFFLFQFLPQHFHPNLFNHSWIHLFRPAHKMGYWWWLFFLLSPRCGRFDGVGRWLKNIIDTQPPYSKKLMKFLCFRSWNTHAHPASSSSRQRKRWSDRWPKGKEREDAGASIRKLDYSIIALNAVPTQAQEERHTR